MADFLKLKEDGNALFKEGKFEEALSCYMKSLDLIKDDSGTDRVALHKNMAACNLKLSKYEAAANHATSALEISPNDPKALFRRCQALEQVGKYEDAYKDAMKLFSVEPKNTAIQPILSRLHIVIQEKAKEHTTTQNKVSSMFRLVFDKTGDDREKRLQAANNLIVLAREESGADMIFKNDGISQLMKLLEEKDSEIILVALRVLASMSQEHRERATAVLNGVTLFRICLLISSESEEISTSATHLLRNIVIALSDLDNYKKDREKHETLRRKDPGLKLRAFPPLQIDDEAQSMIDKIFYTVIPMLNQGKVSAAGRDNIMEFLLKLVTRAEGMSWTKILLDTTEAIPKLLEVAGTLKEHKTIPITDNSRQHASLVLSRIYDDTRSDKEREQFLDQCTNHLVDMFGDDIMESKIEAIMSVSALLQGPFEVGNSILSREGVLDIILAMAQDGIQLHQKVAVEALVLSASKKDKCSGIIKKAVPILKTLYQNANDYIKVRALVGLCKLGSVGGTDASAKTFADGSNTTLAKACRKFLSNPSKDVDLRKWAAEGLAYLTLDADVKEELVNDEVALQSLTDLAKHPDKSILYPVATVFVNLTNSYDKPEVEPELIELAKFSKQHVPEEHEKDKSDYVVERVKKLVKAGVVTALTSLAKTDSDKSRELLARVFLAVCMEQEHRGVVVAQGGAKALIPLSNENTDLGKAIASQALAKIAITTNPEIAFPGQRACEVVRPILQLLHIEKTAIQNYEALLALTNLASMNDTLRKRIIKEKGFPSIEHYMFEDHEELRRGATECVCNLVMCEEALPLFQANNDRVKMLVLFCGEDDEGLVRAAAGTLAMLSHDEKICHKIVSDTKQWIEILPLLAASESVDIQHRGLYILLNLISANEEIAKRVIESQSLEILMAVSKLDVTERSQARQCAEDALAKAIEYGLIKANPQA